MHLCFRQSLRSNQNQNHQIKNPNFPRIAVLFVLSTGLWYITLLGSPHSSSYEYANYFKDSSNISLSTQVSRSSYTNSSTYVILVHSAVANVPRRQVIRKTWGQGQPVYFMLGQSSEDKGHDYIDIVQGSFIDTYRNLTYKHLMGLQWAITKYPDVDYVIKVDDDVFVNIPRLKSYLDLLKSERYQNGSVYCDVVRDALVKRSFRSKWRLGYLEYRPAKFPTYCNGWAIIYRRPIIEKILNNISKVPFMWVDDVYVTGLLLKEVDTEPRQIDPRLLTLNWDPQLAMSDTETLKRFKKSIMGPPQLNIRRLKFLWRLANK